MAILFETERLIARDWEPERDAADAFEMYSDPEVVRFLGRTPTPTTSLEEMLAKLERLVAAAKERSDGTGSWALEDKGSGTVVGAVLVKVLPDGDGNQTGDMEIGWHLKRCEWGKGYASEAGKAALTYAFDVLRVPVAYAVVYKENARSIAVTRRLGMTPKGPTDKYYGVRVELFEIANPSANGNSSRR